MKHITIAIDGPSGAGKSTIARLLAKKLSIAYLDTGAMYRAVTLYALNHGLDKEEEICKALAEIHISFDGQIVFLNQEDVSLAIRGQAVTQNVSLISSYPCVRNYLLESQRKIANYSSCILDGRDIGTVVLPDAHYKFFLTASPEVRAQRRYDEHASSLSYEEVFEDIKRRDTFDSTRPVAPLKQAEDAILIDATNLDIEGVIKKMMEEMNL